MAVSPEYQRLAMRGLVAELQELAGEGGLVMLTVEQIAERVGIERRAAMKLLKDAETAGMVWRGIGKVTLKATRVTLNDTRVTLNDTRVTLNAHGHERVRDLRDHEKHGDHETLSSVKDLSHDHPVAAPIVTAPTKAPSKTKKPKIDPDEDAGFEAFWTDYPKKVGKAAVMTWWAKTAPDDDLLMEILDGLDRWREVWTSRGTELRWIPHPMTWLNQRRWQDEPS
jgi:hypothetical protein